MITLIAAAGENNELGIDSTLPWHLPDDFKRFKALTIGHYIIMGRKTYESLGGPLPNRPHIIITRQENYAPEGCTVVNSIEQALKIAPPDEEVFIIGGGEIFKLAMAFADKIELTRVFGTFDADTFFPEINPDEWELVGEDFHAKDEKHNFDFSFRTFERY